MKIFFIIITFVLPKLSFSSVLEKKEFIKKSPSRNTSLKSLNSKNSYKNFKKGSLPIYMRRSYSSLKSFTASKTKEISFKKSPTLSLKKGDTLFIKIENIFLVHKGIKTPIRAIVLKGRFKGSILLGEAQISENTKRVLIDFYAISPLKSFYSYSFKAVFKDLKGKFGLSGIYKTNLWPYMFLKSALDSVSYQDKSFRKSLRSFNKYLNQKQKNSSEYIDLSEHQNGLFYGNALILESPQNLIPKVYKDVSL